MESKHKFRICKFRKHNCLSVLKCLLKSVLHSGKKRISLLLEWFQSHVMRFNVIWRQCPFNFFTFSRSAIGFGFYEIHSSDSIFKFMDPKPIFATRIRKKMCATMNASIHVFMLYLWKCCNYWIFCADNQDQLWLIYTVEIIHMTRNTNKSIFKCYEAIFLLIAQILNEPEKLQASALFSP